MAIKTILVGLSGGTASKGALEFACRLAGQFGAHLEALHVGLDVEELMLSAGASGFAMPVDGRWIDEITANAAATAEKVKATFTEAAGRYGLSVSDAPEPGKSGAIWRAETGDAPVIVARRARFFDLVVLGRSDRVIDKPHSDAIEQTLLQSGRPVLIAPAEPPAVLGEIIAIGWNGSEQAVRAAASALPLLQKARQAFIIAIGEDEGDSAESIRFYLRMHGVEATVRNMLKMPAVGSGGQLLSAAREQGADLLVMGAYGHAPWREALFGGATREVVGMSLLPLLITH
ncbi:MAG TPA: universal stress protein [Acetobacteraceae bacterium]|nr:universal stress protein [Acetobacteraceae bacterium]